MVNKYYLLQGAINSSNNNIQYSVGLVVVCLLLLLGLWLPDVLRKD